MGVIQQFGGTREAKLRNGSTVGAEYDDGMRPYVVREVEGQGRSWAPRI